MTSKGHIWEGVTIGKVLMRGYKKTRFGGFGYGIQADAGTTKCPSTHFPSLVSFQAVSFDVCDDWRRPLDRWCKPPKLLATLSLRISLQKVSHVLLNCCFSSSSLSFLFFLTSNPHLLSHYHQFLYQHLRRKNHWDANVIHIFHIQTWKAES